MSAVSYPGAGPRCGCGCPYLRGIVLVPLVLSTSEAAFDLVGPTVPELPVESLTCEACGARTVTRDLPPVGIDIAAVLEELATGPAPFFSRAAPACVCGARTLTLTAVLTLVVHAAGATMVAEVSPGPVQGLGGRLSCAGCARSWEAADPGVPAQVAAAIAAFDAALSGGQVRWSE